MDKDIIYFELNNWMPYREYPPEAPYIEWCCLTKNQNDDKYKQPKLRDEEWLKENKLVVVEALLDMSMNFNITATKEWVENNCPSLLTTWSKFIRIPNEGCNLPEGRWDTPFLPYEEKNIGYHYVVEHFDSNYDCFWILDEGE